MNKRVLADRQLALLRLARLARARQIHPFASLGDVVQEALAADHARAGGGHGIRGRCGGGRRRRGRGWNDEGGRDVGARGGGAQTAMVHAAPKVRHQCLGEGTLDPGVVVDSRRARDPYRRADRLNSGRVVGSSRIRVVEEECRHLRKRQRRQRGPAREHADALEVHGPGAPHPRVVRGEDAEEVVEVAGDGEGARVKPNDGAHDVQEERQKTGEKQTGRSNLEGTQPHAPIEVSFGAWGGGLSVAQDTLLSLYFLSRTCDRKGNEELCQAF